MSINKSIISEAILHANDDANRTVDIRNGIVSIHYYEDIFSPTITAKIQVVNAGGAITPRNNSRRACKMSIYNGLPLRGGEKLDLKIAGNSKSNPGLDFSTTETTLYVQSISDVLASDDKETFTLHLVSKEAIANEVTRVKKRYSGNILDSVKLILENVLKTTNFDASKFDKVANSYDFIGNMRKPFWTLQWLASKCVPTIANETAGFVFYQTRDGFHFKSIDNLIKKRAKATYTYTEGIQSYDENDRQVNNDRKILNYTIKRNQNLIEKLRLGTFSSERHFFNPLTFTFSSNDVYGENRYKNKVKSLGSELNIPKIEGLDLNLGQTSSRIVSGVFDVGAVTGKEVIKDESYKNADPTKYQSQSFMRYNTLFLQTLDITVPSNTNLRAGDVIECLFPVVSASKNKEFDDETSGLYMIKDLCHYCDDTRSFTTMKLVRDTHGINTEERDDND